MISRPYPNVQNGIGSGKEEPESFRYKIPSGVNPISKELWLVSYTAQQCGMDGWVLANRPITSTNPLHPQKKMTINLQYDATKGIAILDIPEGSGYQTSQFGDKLLSKVVIGKRLSIDRKAGRVDEIKKTLLSEKVTKTQSEEWTKDPIGINQ